MECRSTPPMAMACLPLLALTILSSSMASPGPVALTQENGLRELTELVCIDCHRGSRAPEADAAARLDLSAALDAPGEHLELLTAAFAQVRQGFMPPSDAAGGGFDDEERDEWLAGAKHVVAALGPGPGSSTLRRMTRRQMRRTLREVLGLEVPVERFLPRDASGYGFDTTGDTLFVTPLYYESWYECVDYIVDALGDGPVVKRAALMEIGREETASRAAITSLLRLAFSREPTATEGDALQAMAVESVGAGLGC